MIMEFFGQIFIAAIAISFVFLGLVLPWRAPSLPWWKRAVSVVAGFLLIVGAVGFCGAGLSTVGGLDWLPPAFEWPVGEATGVVTTPDGFHVVPHGPSSRVQVYSPEWKFVRGWRVRSLGLHSPLHAAEDGTIDVFTRDRKHHVYDIEGRLLSVTDTTIVLPERGQTVTVSTSVWLWVFTSPFYSWLVGAIGFLLMLHLEGRRIRPRKQDAKILERVASRRKSP